METSSIKEKWPSRILPAGLGQRIRASLLAKVSLLITIGGIYLAAFFAIISTPFIHDYEAQRNLTQLQDLLSTVTNTTQIACFTNDERLAKEIAEGLLSNETVAGVSIVSDAGLLAEVGQIPAGGEKASRVEQVVKSPFNKSQIVGKVVIIADSEKIRARAKDYATFFSGMMLLEVIASTMLVAYLMMRTVVQPVTQFAEHLHRHDAESGTLLSPPRHAVHDEIGMLANSFNQMMHRMDGLLREANAMRDRAERKELQFRALAENSPDIIARYDAEGRMLFANPAYMREMGIPLNAPACNAFCWMEYWRPQLPAETYLQHLQHAMQTDLAERIYWEWITASGASVCHEVYIVAEHDANGNITGALAMGRNISERREFERQLLFQANHDALTRLPNRSLLKDRLLHAIQQASRDNSRLAVIFIDLDNFKQVNDSEGHDAGDELLKQLARRMSTTLRESDTVSRLGGDEFVILLERVSDRPDIDNTIRKLIEAINRPVLLGATSVIPSASFGVAVYPEDGDNVEALMSNADTAMYVAKEEGLNNYRYFSAKMNDELRQWMDISSRLHIALENNAFSLHYQPKASLIDRCPVGMEALIRWHDPELGWVSPARFIPVAEKNGTIERIGQWVLHEACRQMRAWLDAGHTPGPVAINLSAAQSLGDELVHQISHALTVNRLPGEYLEVEITESIVMADTEESIKAFWALRDLGVQVSVDDFGTGYSSLSYLKRLPVNKLKIDKSFIDDIEQDANDLEIVRAVIAMAHSLGLIVVAEGVETHAQLASLQEAGCDQIQGYLYSRPLAAEAMSKWLETPTELNSPVNTHQPTLPKADFLQ
jgi:diguanylate cyclase (GGDEF)-like protein/PAS domain S-box-containing protein